MPTHLGPNVLDSNLHVLIRVFLLQQGIQCLVHLDEELARVCR